VNNLGPIRIGQFSESPVLAVATALGLDKRYGVSWETSRVASSPQQFASLRDGEIDIAVTSPDNVLLYATTDKNPLSGRLALRMLRPIDRGLGLALYTRPEISGANDFNGATLGVDVMSSGFALLLLSMLRLIGVDPKDVSFEARGATPMRVKAIKSGEIAGSILNAESAVEAESSGFSRWATSVDVSSDYLGTVLVQLDTGVSDVAESFLQMWEEATQTILNSTPESVIELFQRTAPQLSQDHYVGLVQSSEFGLISGREITMEQLLTLAQIRSDAGSYTPAEADIAKLLAR
jgi:ABC-type nitrate/sulfonate/bicarbonate transport system substrate-binding protein